MSIRGLSAIKGNLGRLGSESSDEIFIFTAAARSWTFFYGTQKSGGRYVHLEGIPELDRYGSPLLSIMLSIPNCTIALQLSILSTYPGELVQDSKTACFSTVVLSACSEPTSTSVRRELAIVVGRALRQGVLAIMSPLA